jgi:hypothetical protein
MLIMHFGHLILAGLLIPITVLGPAAAADQHWAFQPIVRKPIPVSLSTVHLLSPIDVFIRARLDARGMEPVPSADRQTLIRRVTFDLTGLPPTPAEIEAFLADTRQGAWERVIDRLLASPAYGERWARHWLDVVRYADSNGLDENRAYIQAFRYRDYVINAFNDDMPFDQFVHEQIAGDLLPLVQLSETADQQDRIQRLAEKTRRHIATGFLVLGPKGLREVDGTKMELDIIDDQVATIGNAFLALTLECARCHDHKFDPISTEDYYALAGIFKSTRTMERIFNKRGKGDGFWLEVEVPLDLSATTDWETEHYKHATLVRKLTAGLPPTVLEAANIAEQDRTDQQNQVLTDFSQADLKQGHMLNQLQKLQGASPKKPAMGRAMVVTDGKIVDLRVMLRGSHLDQGDHVPRRFPRALSPQTTKMGPGNSGRLELARWLTSADNPLTSRVFVNRIWQWHFGRGLVETPDNFGSLSGPPTHPRLLDWLADEFRSGGWSTKRLHRLLLCSATYRRGNGYEPRSAKVDVENELLWRFRRRRLEAEEVRDSLLAVAGTLDHAMHGSLLSLKARDYVDDAETGRHLVSYDNSRRSVYQPVIRNKVYNLFQTFDFPNPSMVNGRRSSTTVSPQVLLMMNSPLVIGCAEKMAEQVTQLPNRAMSERLNDMYLTVLGRFPDDLEKVALLAYLDRYASRVAAGTKLQRRQAAWNSLAQSVLMLNEFLYVD